MVISVFYSWQSEHPESVNRYFIRDALKKAMSMIQQGCGLEERPEVDHDTKGVPGLPDIGHTIFSKIEASSAFIADVSFTSKSIKGSRFCANANVLIELGYALHSLGDKRLILVMNDTFGSPDKQMPFNLAARRWPIRYNLPPDADKETRKKVLSDLSFKLADALKVMADSGILLSTSATSSPIRVDRLLFAKLLEKFPYNSNMIRLLRDHDVGGSFPFKWLQEIINFTQEWNDALHEFVDPTLEGKRVDFMQKITSFQNELGANTWTSDDSYYLSMRLNDYMELDEFGGNHRQDKMNELNAMGIEAYKAHQELIRACKVMLGSPEAS